VTWHPAERQIPGPFAWKDALEEDLGHDPDGRRFAAIAERMLTGRYYPPDALEFFGPWDRLEVGDRILQRARLIPSLRSPGLWAMTEVHLAELSEHECALGYLTTKHHFGRGIWIARLSRTSERLTLRVEAFTTPHSIWFWIGFPYARWLQLRAWRRAVEVFGNVT